MVIFFSKVGFSNNIIRLKKWKFNISKQKADITLNIRK